MREGESLLVYCPAGVVLQRVLAPIAQRQCGVSALEANRLPDGRAGVDASLLFHAQRHLGDIHHRRIQPDLPIPDRRFGAVDPHLNALGIHIQMQSMRPSRRLASVPAGASLFVRRDIICKLGRLGKPGQSRRRTVPHRGRRRLQQNSIRPQGLAGRQNASEQEQVQPLLQRDLGRRWRRLPELSGGRASPFSHACSTCPLSAPRCRTQRPARGARTWV